MSFRLDRSLLKPNFDGYKYWPGFLRVNSTTALYVPRELTLDDSFYDFDYLKLLSLSNGLFINEFDNNFNVAYYFGNDGCIIRVQLEKDSDDLNISKVHDMKLAEECSLEYPPVIVFAQKDLCLVAHSNSKVDFFRITHDQQLQECWQFCDSKDLTDIIGKFYCYSAVVCQEKQCLRLAVCTIDRCSSTKKNENTLKIVDIFFKCSDTTLKLTKVELHAKFKSDTVPSLARFISCDQSLCCFMSDGNISSDVDISGSGQSTQKHFSWSQTTEMITIKPTTILKNMDKNAIDCQFKPQSLFFKWIGEDGEPKVSLEAKFVNPIIEDSCRWTISDNNELTIYIIKQEPKIWPQLFFDDSVDSTLEHIIEEEEKHFLAEAGSGLDAFTTTTPTPSDPAGANKGLGDDDYNEFDCSTYQDVYVANLNTLTIQKMETNSIQLLFSAYDAVKGTLKVCLDNMEDGIVWRFVVKDQNVSVIHESTFHALAYIAATKRDTIFKFVERANQSFFVVMDCNGHVLVYENPNHNISIQSKVRQSSLNIRERPIGAAALASKIVILTKTSFYVANVNI